MGEHDPDAKTISIVDTGIGMSKADLINNLGTVAKSGTTNFLEAMSEGADANLIGQFGVGFYSAFLVADKVSVTSKCNDDPVQHVWESSADASFTVVDDPRGNTLGRGTRVTLHLKEDAHDYLSEDKLKETTKKYSQFIQFPIYVKVKKEVDAEAEEEEEEEKKTPTKKTVYEWEQVNTQKAIWLRAKEDVTEEEYTEFYKSISKDYLDPLAYTHFNAEGEIEFKSILYLPKKAPFDMMDNYWTKKSEVKLYVRRVLVAEKFEELLPRYLNFVRGVVDSDDLPLNVSREQLQQHKLLKVIKKKLVRKTLDMIKKIDESLYPAFWREFSTNIKLGVIEDAANRSRLAKLLRFTSSAGNYVSLSQYVERMKDKQEQIFYMGGSTLKEVQESPFVERLLKKGYEVLYLTEAVDEYAVSALPEFEGKKFQNVAKDGFSIDGDTDAAKARKEEMKGQFEPLIKWMGEDALKDHILRAEVSERLDASPCALITSRFGWTANMQRIIGSQTHSKTNDMQRDYYLSQKKAMEINPRHPLIKELLRRVEDNPGDEVAKDMALMMFNTATLRSGYMLKDTNVFALSIEKMMRETLGVDLDEAVEEEEELPEEAPEEEGEDDEEEEEEEEEEDEEEETKEEE